jgi:hypothetical protein
MAPGNPNKQPHGGVATASMPICTVAYCAQCSAGKDPRIRRRTGLSDRPIYLGRGSIRFASPCCVVRNVIPALDPRFVA